MLGPCGDRGKLHCSLAPAPNPASPMLQHCVQPTRLLPFLLSGLQHSVDDSCGDAGR